MRFILIFLLGSTNLIFCSGEAKNGNLQQANVAEVEFLKQTSPENFNAEPEEKMLWMADYFTGENSLRQDGFEIKKKIRKVKPVDLPEAGISDLLIQKNGKTVLTLGGIYYPLGNALDFGLFEFLAGGDKQLVVSDTIPRGGNHYVINLAEKPEILFDSRSWSVGREDFGVVDIEGDGIYEIFMESPEFYGFENFSSAETPLTTIYFKFDRGKRKFLPANHKFPDYALKNVEKGKAEMNDRKGVSQLARVLEITLQYIYAGREKEAWEFYEREYKNADAAAVKAKIKKILAGKPIYKYINGASH